MNTSEKHRKTGPVPISLPTREQKLAQDAQGNAAPSSRPWRPSVNTCFPLTLSCVSSVVKFPSPWLRLGCTVLFVLFVVNETRSPAGPEETAEKVRPFCRKGRAPEENMGRQGPARQAGPTHGDFFSSLQGSERGWEAIMTVLVFYQSAKSDMTVLVLC